MDATELNRRLLAVGETIKAKGWATASIDIYASYLAIFDREPGILDPMISYRPSIRASTRNRHGTPSTQDYVRDSWDIKTLDQAVAKLEESAENMPRMNDEESRLDQARAKLSDDDRRLLGIR